jgi:hypothetical protein
LQRRVIDTLQGKRAVGFHLTLRLRRWNNKFEGEANKFGLYVSRDKLEMKRTRTIKPMQPRARELKDILASFGSDTGEFTKEDEIKLGSDVRNSMKEEDMEYANTYIPSTMHGATSTMHVFVFNAEPDRLSKLAVHYSCSRSDTLVSGAQTRFQKHKRT